MINFSSIHQVLYIHENQIQIYGGKPGIRDLKLLQSAIAMPKLSFDKRYLHENIFHMAASYTYHICQNYPFLDGNKRTALASAIIFMKLNGMEIQDKKGILYQAMMNIASGKEGKDYLREIFQRLKV